MRTTPDMTGAEGCLIGFATELDPHRREAWSGTNRYMYGALEEAGCALSQLGPIGQSPTLALNRISKVSRRLTGVDLMLNRSLIVAGLKAHLLERAIQQSGVDVVIAPAGSALVARLPPGIPMVHASDTTIPLLVDYYPLYTGLPAPVLDRAIEVERAALHRADLLLYPTEWAARSAVEDYGIDPGRILVQPFGANIEDPPGRAEVLAPRRPGPLRLLFCGVDWVRKGGETALQAMDLLRADGVEAELLVLGCEPPADRALPAGVTVIPFLDKIIPEERDRFRRAFLEADVLVLPTQAECYGLVFCEAAAFGAVSVAAATGGIPEVVRDGTTGFTVPPDGTARDYADRLARLARDPGLLDRMRIAARDDFETRLNWSTWGQAVRPRIEGLVARRPAARNG